MGVMVLGDGPFFCHREAVIAAVVVYFLVILNLIQDLIFSITIPVLRQAPDERVGLR
jgi:hypothetical protein